MSHQPPTPVTMLIDSKGRTWHVADMTGTGDFDRVVPMGSPRATLRRFTWDGGRPWERMTRWYFLRSPRLPDGIAPDPAEWAIDRDTVWQQLRASWSFDDLRTQTRSTGEMIQELYSRRGTGRR